MGLSSDADAGWLSVLGATPRSRLSARHDDMSDSTANAEASSTGSAATQSYVVVARRYRPQLFEELIGQQHVAKALSNAIETSRVGHAYLFTGARGVGKTSAARIFAKALNCEQGPTGTPCNQCDICRSISSGDDVDVLEIDGASNRGIDEIRQLRQNVNMRPSRSLCKIYIIDEVHMLTREAFNALLKTLEEPPEHVKFIFCTTEPTKIPITILSRCQRFDFAGILTSSIVDRLQQIIQAEGVEAEPEALEALARRAAGSMRDSQSLLEQLLAFSPSRITLDDVHAMLGTAGEERLATLVGHLVDRNAAAALAELNAALGQGVDVAQLLEQLFGYFRDCMAAAVDCPADTFLYASPAGQEKVIRAGKGLGLTTILAVMQIIEQTLSRIRYSTQGRILAELALVRICALEDLDELPGLIAELQTGTMAAGRGPSGAQQAAAAAPATRDRTPRTAGRHGPQATGDRGPRPAGNPGPSPPTASAGPETALADRPAVAMTPENATVVWTQALAKISGTLADHAKQFDHVAIVEQNRLAIHFKSSYAFQKSICERPEAVKRFEQALAEVAGQTIRVSFSVDEDQPNRSEPVVQKRRHVPQQQRLLEVAEHPMVRRAHELFGAQPTRGDDTPKRE